MKKFGSGAILVMTVAAVAATSWSMRRASLPDVPITRSTPIRPLALAFEKTVDLSNLPRALEPPLLQVPLQPGDLAPDFDLPDQMGHLHRLSNLRGQTVVLSFYPRDLTLSCVTEAISFDRELPNFQMRGAKVFSVSVQGGASKASFANRYNISYPLLADTGKKAARAYQVLREDGVAGRVTFVIGIDGRILWTDQDVHARTHARDVINWLDSRKSNLSIAPSKLRSPFLERSSVQHSTGRAF